MNLKISRPRMINMIQEILYLRAVMVYEIRYMGEDLLEAMETKK